MNYIYLITSLFLVYSFYKIEKTKKLQNGFFWVILSVSLFFIFNTFIVNFLSLVKIKSSPLNLSLINTLISSILFILQKKKILNYQKYYYKKRHMVNFAIIIFIILFISIMRFGYDFSNIVFETTDPAAHFTAAAEFSEVQSVLSKKNTSNIIYSGFDRMQNAYYINSGLFMSTFNMVEKYRCFIIFEVILLMLTSLIFYITSVTLLKSDKLSWICLIITFLYLFGYPLNNMLFGFGYLGFSIFTFSLIICLQLLLYRKCDLKIYLPIMFLLNFNLFFSYFLFMPIFYLAQGLIYIYDFIFKKTKFIELVKIFSITLLIPFFIGCLYFFVLIVKNEEVTLIASEGYIYRSLFSNFVLISPIIFYVGFMEIKKRKINLLNILFLIIITIIAFLFIIGLNGNISSYYFFKFYFPLWTIVWLLVAVSFSYSNKINVNSLGTIFLMIILLAIGTLRIESKISSVNILFNPEYVSSSFLNLYIVNENYIYTDAVIFNKQELELLEGIDTVKNECNINDFLDSNVELLQSIWMTILIDVLPIYEYTGHGDFYTYEFNYDDFLQSEERKCFLYFNDSKELDYFDNDNYSILYENEAGKIYKKAD